MPESSYDQLRAIFDREGVPYTEPQSQVSNERRVKVIIVEETSGTKATGYMCFYTKFLFDADTGALREMGAYE